MGGHRERQLCPGDHDLGGQYGRPRPDVVASATIDGVGYKIWSEGKAGTVSDTVSVLDSISHPDR